MNDLYFFIVIILFYILHWYIYEWVATLLYDWVFPVFSLQLQFLWTNFKNFFFVLLLNSCLYCHINFKSLPYPPVEIFALKYKKKNIFGWLIQTETDFSRKEREIKEKVNSTFCRATLRLSKHMIHKFILFSLCDRLVR